MPSPSLLTPDTRPAPLEADRGRRRLPARWSVFAAVLAGYVALSVAVAAGSPLERLDRWGRALPFDRSSGRYRFALDRLRAPCQSPRAIARSSTGRSADAATARAHRSSVAPV